MVMVDVDYRSLLADASRLAWSKDWWTFGTEFAVINRTGELLQLQ